MSRKVCRRKVWPLVNATAHAISGATMIPESDLDRLRIRELSALEAFAKGNATPSDFRDLCDMLNLAETMAQSGIGPEVMPACESAQAALLEAKDRYERTHRLGLSGPGLTALRGLYEFHDLQRTSVDRSTYERAIAKTRNRIRSAHPGVRVLT
jgi:hypothetical protein